MNAKLQFTGTPSQLRAMYEHGWGIRSIMERTEKPYIEIRAKLLEAGTTLITGGPHDTSECDHKHSLQIMHDQGATCCQVSASRRR